MHRLRSGDLRLLLLGSGSEAISIVAYVVLFRRVFSSDSGRIGWLASAQITLAGDAAAKLLAAAGAGGVALTAWALRASGLRSETVARGMVCLEVLLYGIYIAALIVCGLGLHVGLFAGPAPPTLTLAPAFLGILIVALALSTQRFAKGSERWLRRRATGARPRSARWWKLAADVPQALGAGVRTALALARKHRSAPLAALAYWTFDIGALWAAFHAFGEPPPGAVLVLGYFLGSLANALPLPGGLGGVEGGMIGAFLGLGVNGGLAVVAVLAYRTISYWLPTLPSGVAYVRLRGTVATWRTPAADTGGGSVAGNRPNSASHKVVIIGCGFAGLSAARALRRAPVQVTVIDRTNHHLFQPLLYQMATGILSAGDIATPIRELLRTQRNAEVLLGEVVALDAERRHLTVDTLAHRTEVRYDSLIVATGAQQSYFGNDRFSKDAPGLKTVDDALELRGRIFGAFELAELETNADARRAWLTFVVVGAGPTGVEMAGQLAELSRRSLRRNFRSIEPRDARVILLDAGPRALAPFPDSLQRSAVRSLKRLGVEVHFGAKVTGVDPGGIDVSTKDPTLRRIDARTKIWAAGVEGSPLGRIVATATGAAIDHAGRVRVSCDCTVWGHPEIFVVGDLMHLDGLAGVAEVAMQSGAHAGRTIGRRVRGAQIRRPFHYRDLGTMATVSRFRAIASVGSLRLSGFAGWLAWLLIHLVFLTGFKNRLAALASWIVAFVSHGRAQRTITAQQVLARGTALGAASPAIEAASRSDRTGPLRFHLAWIHESAGQPA